MFSSKQILWRTQNLLLTESGTWWAMWRLDPLPYTDPSPKAREQVRSAHEALFQSLSGEALLIGLTAREDHAELVNRMMEGVRMDKCPEYLTEVELTLDALAGAPVGDRIIWLATPLRADSVKARALSLARSSWHQVTSAVSLPVTVPSEFEVAAAARSARRIEEAIPGSFHPVRATAAETTWIHFQAQTRGLDSSAPAPKTREEATHVFRSGRELTEPLLDEGGQADVSAAERFNPFRRKYLKVDSAAADESSYQVLMALTGYPAAGWVFPGVEWLSWLDKFPFDTDWAIRLHVFSAAIAKKKNKSAERTLDDQLSQQAGSTGITGNVTALERNVGELQEFHQRMNADDREVEVQATFILCVAGTSPAEAMEKARAIKSHYKETEFIFDDVLGEQTTLWEAMQPGVPTGQIVREYAQLATGKDLSSVVPLISKQLGDDYGMLFAINQETAAGHPVYLNPYASTQANFSGSVAVCGELGGGKSVTLKALGGGIVDRGGRLVVIDRSAPAEYAKFAHSLVPDQTAIVEILRPKFSLDPIRVFNAVESPLMTHTLLSSMLRMEAFDEKGAFLGEVLDPAYMATHKINSLRDLLDHLRTLEGVPEAEQLARTMNVIASKPDLSAVLFDPDLPPLPLDKRAIVFCTRKMQLPSEAELKSDMQFKAMGIQKIFGSAIYDLLAEIGRAVCFATDEEFAAFLVDEAHHMTLQPRGHEICMQFVLEGRKSAAAFLIGTQAPAHLGSKELRSLIPVRIVHRLTGDLSKEGAELIVGEKYSQELVESIAKLSPPDPRDPDRKVPIDRRGECYIRDARGRSGQCRVLLPFRADRREAMLTTPPSVVGLED